jgi:hypothetical protein
MRKKIPKFESEEEEREFWAVHDSTEYVDWAKAQPAVLPNLRRQTIEKKPEQASSDDEGK